MAMCTCAPDHRGCAERAFSGVHISGGAFGSAITVHDARVRVESCTIDGRMATIWAFCVLFIIDLFVVDNLTDTRDVLVWPVLLYSCLLFVMLVCFSMYIRKHMVTARLPAVTRSMLAWQVLLLNGVYFIISVAYPAPGEEWSVLFIHITIFCMLSAPVVLDACNTSPAEHKVSLIGTLSLSLSLFALN
jgi:hypothetical protein